MKKKIRKIIEFISVVAAIFGLIIAALKLLERVIIKKANEI